MVLAVDVVDDEGGGGLVALFILLDGEVAVGVNVRRICQALVVVVARGVCEGKKYYSCPRSLQILHRI
jgi:hypothetical protein